MGKWAYAQLLQQQASDIIMLDISWCGGLTEALKIAALADSHQLPIAPHNCSGPFTHQANVHLGTAVPNLFVLESVQTHYLKEYPSLVTDVAVPDADGCFHPPEGVGLGTRLKPEIMAAMEVTVSDLRK